MLEDYQAEQASKDAKVGRFTANTPYEEVDDNGNLALFGKFKQKAKV